MNTDPDADLPRRQLARAPPARHPRPPARARRRVGRPARLRLAGLDRRPRPRRRRARRRRARRAPGRGRGRRLDDREPVQALLGGARPLAGRRRHRPRQLPDRPLRARGPRRPARAELRLFEPDPLAGPQPPTSSRSRRRRPRPALPRQLPRRRARRHARPHRARPRARRAGGLGPLALRRRRAGRRSSGGRRARRGLHVQVPQRRPGAPAFLYVAEELQPRLRSPIWGWFGQRDQFAMERDYDPVDGVGRFLAGTPPVLDLAAVEEGVRLTAEAGVDRLRAKSVALCDLIVELHDAWLAPLGLQPRIPARRGAPRLPRLAPPRRGVADLPRADRARRRRPRLPRPRLDPPRRRPALHRLRRHLGRARPPPAPRPGGRAADGGRQPRAGNVTRR